jgi:hypothetical protein
MVRELRSYYSPLSSGYIEISELNDQTHTIAKRFSGGEANNAYSGILISIHQISKCLYPWLSQTGKVPDPVTIELPAVVETHSFDRVLDLRIPQCAAWFCRNLTRLEWDVGGLAFSLKETLDKFPHLLPSLLVQTHGGGEGATRIAGQWLRSLGAEALIFPSARSNSSVAVLDERVVDWYGWNLVDYRNAGPTNWLTFDITTDWVRYLTLEVNQPKSRIYEEVEIAAVDRGRRTGSWHVRNLEEVETTIRLGEIAMYLYERVMPELVKTRRDILLRFLMGDKSPATFSINASILFKALVGDQDLRLVVLDRAGREESGLYGSLDLPTAFRRMDAKLS